MTDIDINSYDFSDYKDISLDTLTIDTSSIDEELLSKYNYKAVEDTFEFFNDMDSFIIINGLPVAPVSKLAALNKVVNKIFSSCGEITSLNIPTDETKTKGFAFVQYKEPTMAKKAIKLLNGKNLDNSHQFKVNSLKEIEEFGIEEFNSTFVKPKVNKPISTDLLDNWLLDGREQFLMSIDEDSQLVWNQRSDVPKLICDNNQWVEAAPPKFTSNGSFLISLHKDYAKSWGGSKMDFITDFHHKNVIKYDISNTSKYLITFSSSPINETYGMFDQTNYGHSIAIWDIQTGALLKTFPLPSLSNEIQKPLTWPFIKWSNDDSYCCRAGPDAIAIYKSSENFKLNDLVKIPNLQDFEFSPNKIVINKNKNIATDLLIYWTPDIQNQNCKVTLMEYPKKNILRSVNMMQALNMSFYWQNNSEYLAIKIDKFSNKAKTKLCSNIEIINFAESNFPVTKLELKERILTISWEPNSDRFVTAAIDENKYSLDDTLPPKVVQFFNTLNNAGKSWVLAYQTGRSHVNKLSWSPLGRILTVNTCCIDKKQKNSELIFYDLDYPGQNNIITKLLNIQKSEKLILSKDKKSRNRSADEDVNLSGTQVDRSGSIFNNGNNLKLRELKNYTNFSFTDVAWDTTGRFFTAFCSAAKYSTGHGYAIFGLNGLPIRREEQMGFKWFAWRPRPKSTLTSQELKKIKKNLNEYAKKFKDLDSRTDDLNYARLQQEKQDLLEEWTAYRNEVAKQVGKEYIFDIDPYVDELEKTEYNGDVVISTKDIVLEDEEFDALVN